MHCTDDIKRITTRSLSQRWATMGSIAAALIVGGCGSDPKPSTPAAPPPPIVMPSIPRATPGGGVQLPPPTASRNWNEFKLQAAKRMVAANPNGSYTGQPQQMLLAIPVLQIELNADGSIKDIDVMRRPSQAFETTQMAIDAVKRAGPFGDVSKLPKPWKFVEAFLFNDDKRFKPRTLDAQ